MALSEGVSPEKHQDSFAVLEQMDQCHPEYPHWYLPWLGVNRAMQGGGLGGELLKRFWRWSTRVICPPTLRLPTHAPSRSTSVRGSRSSTWRKPEPARPSPSC